MEKKLDKPSLIIFSLIKTPTIVIRIFYFRLKTEKQIEDLILFSINDSFFINVINLTVENFRGKMFYIFGSFILFNFSSIYIFNSTYQQNPLLYFQGSEENVNGTCFINNLSFFECEYDLLLISYLSYPVIIQDIKIFNCKNGVALKFTNFDDHLTLKNGLFLKNENIGIIRTIMTYMVTLQNMKFNGNNNCYFINSFDFFLIAISNSYFHNNLSKLKSIFYFSNMLVDIDYSQKLLLDSLIFSNNSLILENLTNIGNPFSTIFLIEFFGEIQINKSIFTNNSFKSQVNSKFITSSPCLYTNEKNRLTLLIKDTNFQENVGLYDSNCIHFSGDSLFISNCLFYNNGEKELMKETSSGGVLNLINTCQINIENSCFILNSAGFGGGIYMEIPESPIMNISQIVIKNITANKNIALYEAGFIGILYGYSGDFIINISVSNFQNNICFGNGGVFFFKGLSLHESSLFFSNSNLFRNNTSYDGGGVFYFILSFCPVFINQNIFEANNDYSQKTGGGVIFNGASCNIFSETCYFKNNFGLICSEIHFSNNLKITSFTDNSSFFTNSMVLSTLIDVMFFSQIYLNNSIFADIFIYNCEKFRGSFMSISGEGLADLTNLLIVNITGEFINSLIYLTETSKFCLNGTLLFDLDLDGPLLLIFNILDDNFIHVSKNFFFLISLPANASLFKIKKLNNGKLCLISLLCSVFKGEFLNSQNAEIYILDFNFRNSLDENFSNWHNLFTFTSSKAIIKNFIIIDSSFQDCFYFFCLISTTANFTNIYFSRNETLIDTINLFYFEQSNVQLKALTTNNIFSYSPLINLKNCYLLLCNFSIFINENYDINPLAFLYSIDSYNLSISDGFIYNLLSYDGTAFFIQNTNEFSTNITLNNIFLIQAISFVSGSPVKIENSYLYMKNCTFLNNIGWRGGALLLLCSVSSSTLITKFCSYYLQDCLFIGNSAIYSGGGFFWENSLPIENNCIFYNNSAFYGINKASNPIKIIMVAGENDLLCSGEWIQMNDERNLSFLILDYYNQVSNSFDDESTYLSINFYEKNKYFNISKFLGDEFAKIEEGVVNFTRYGIKSMPNSSIGMILRTNLIPFFSPFLKTDDHHKNYYGQYYFAFNLTLRSCLVGEIFSEFDYSCLKCKPKFYSVELNSKECKECMPNAICHGGSSIEILPGYWRENVLSDKIYRCNILKFGCKGGSTEKLCFPGYEGPLCGVCVYNETDKYFRNAMGICELCKEGNVVYAISVLIIVFLILILLIHFSLKESYEYSNCEGVYDSNATVLFNIMINYLQKISIITNIEIKWPDSGSSSNSMNMFNDFGNIIGIFECPFSRLALYYDFPLFSLKRILSTVTFFFIIIGGILFWVGKYVFKKILKKRQSKRRILDNIKITIIAIYVIGLQPLLNFYTKSLYCVDINGKKYLKLSTNLECWEGEHMDLVRNLIGPGLIINILPPLYLLYYITSKRKNLTNKKFLLISYLVTTGYKKKYFYWEYVLLLIKIILMVISIFLNGKPIICVMLILFVFFVFINIQYYVSPFENPVYNRLIILKAVAIYFSYGSNFYFFYENSQIAVVLVTVLMGILNVSFVLVWTYLLYRNLKPSIHNALLNIYLCLSKKKEKNDSNKTKAKNSFRSGFTENKKKVSFRNTLNPLQYA